jgi:hypothetical protein
MPWTLDQVVINMLPDDVLLEIFDFYREDPAFHTLVGLIYTWRWEALIQVCRRWRCVILGSPRRLGLRIVCTETNTHEDIAGYLATLPYHLNLSVWGG